MLSQFIIDGEFRSFRFHFTRLLSQALGIEANRVVFALRLMSGVRSGGEVREDNTVQMMEIQLAFVPEKLRTAREHGSHLYKPKS